MIPTLETARLTLRGHRASDFAACIAMWSDPLVTRFIGGKPSTSEQVWQRMLAYAGHWQWQAYGFWLIEEKATGAFVGELGFASFKREIEPSLEGSPEIGWALTASMHGKGYATEAVRAALNWGEAHLAVKRTVCMIDPDNLASKRVAEKCGYAEFCRTTYRGTPTVLYERYPK